MKRAAVSYSILFAYQSPITPKFVMGLNKVKLVIIWNLKNWKIKCEELNILHWNDKGQDGKFQCG